MLALAFQTCNLSFKEFELNDSFLQEKRPIKPSSTNQEAHRIKQASILIPAKAFTFFKWEAATSATISLSENVFTVLLHGEEPTQCKKPIKPFAAELAFQSLAQTSTVWKRSDSVARILQHIKFWLTHLQEMPGWHYARFYAP